MWTSVFVPHAFVVLFVDVNVCFSRGVEGWIPLMTCMSIASCCPSHVRLCRFSSVILRSAHVKHYTRICADISDIESNPSNHP